MARNKYYVRISNRGKSFCEVTQVTPMNRTNAEHTARLLIAAVSPHFSGCMYMWPDVEMIDNETDLKVRFTMPSRKTTELLREEGRKLARKLGLVK